MATQNSKIGALVAGVMLIGFGMLAMFGQLFQAFHFWSYVWPLALIGCGAMFFVGMFAGGKSVAGLAIPGSILTVVGLVQFVQMFTGYWSIWSYSWTLILAAVGLGIFIMGAYQGDEHRCQAGLKVMKVAAVFFIVFGTFFGLILSPFGLANGSYLFPVLLILLGLYLVISRSGILGSRKSSDDNFEKYS
jgi:hypothetical protein